jgi:hypothetical protein
MFDPRLVCISLSSFWWSLSLWFMQSQRSEVPDRPVGHGLFIRVVVRGLYLDVVGRGLTMVVLG